MQVSGPPDQRLAQLLGAQHACVARRQLLAAGLTRSQIQTRIERGQLEAIHQGVYTAAGIRDAPLRREAAALLACGPAAALAGTTAARMWKLIPPSAATPPSSEPVQVVLAAGRRGRSRTGIEVHRSRTLTAKDVRHVDGLPVTSPERTLIDLAIPGVLTDRQLERALDEALAQRITTLPRIKDRVGKNPTLPGTARTRRLLAGRGSSAITDSDAEELFLSLIRQAGLPHPQAQARLDGFVVDFYWPEAKFAVEVDGYRWHQLKTNFERDRHKDRALLRRGIQTTRITWQQLQDDALQLMVDIATTLDRRTRAAG